MAAYELTKTILKDSANLKAYYRFESGALTTDSSGNSNTLTNNNTVSEGTGVYGGAADFESGSSQYFSIIDGSQTGLDLTADMSFSAWVNFESTPSSGNRMSICGKYTTTGNQRSYAFSLFNDGGTLKLNLLISNDGINGENFSVNWTPSTSTWYHIVVTRVASSTLTRFYVNGKYMGSATGTFTSSYNGTGEFQVGAFNNVNYLDGLLDDLAVFSSVLTADQIKELYEGRYIGEWWPQSNLVGLWHLNGNSTDSSGNNNHGTDTAITYSLANGKFGQGGGFNGSTSKIDLGNSSTLRPTAITVNVWANFTSLPNAYNCIISNGAAAGTNFYVKSNGKIAVYSIVNYDGTGAYTLSTGQWYMLTFTYDSTNGLKGYVNGGLDASVSPSGNMGTTSSYNMFLSEDPAIAGRKITGKLDEVAIFSRALSAAEIRKWYAWSVGRYL